MLISSAILFFLIAIFFMVLGIIGVAGVSIEMGKIFLYVFVILATISLFSKLFGF